MTTAENQRLEIYKQTVEMADRVSARRGVANAFFVSVNAALAAALGVVSSMIGSEAGLGIVAICLVGILLSLVWWLQLRSYRDLNRAKFQVIQEIEERLVEKPFAREDALLAADKVDRWRSRYAELGSSERIVPWLFVCLYVALAVASLIK